MSHLEVLVAIEGRGGRLVASFVLDSRGQTLGSGRDGRIPGQRREANRRARCSGCDQTGHILSRCNGPGQPPKPTHRERRMGLQDGDGLEAAREELRKRTDERRRRRR